MDFWEPDRASVVARASANEVDLAAISVPNAARPTDAAAAVELMAASASGRLLGVGLGKPLALPSVQPGGQYHGQHIGANVNRVIRDEDACRSAQHLDGANDTGLIEMGPGVAIAMRQALVHLVVSRHGDFGSEEPLR